MVFELVCSRCGYAIYSGFDLRAPAEILKQFGNKCQSCNAKLTTDTFKVEVQKFDGTFTPVTQKSTIAVQTRVRPLAPLPLTDS
jgi:DNA-directed RNA polymerase subunit RPC12/RpoP